MFRGAFRLIGAFALVLAMVGGSIFAQETSGAVRGNVTDPSGAAVPVTQRRDFSVYRTSVGTALTIVPDL